MTSKSESGRLATRLLEKFPLDCGSVVAWHVHCSSAWPMAAFVRVLLWMAVIVAPGGVLLLPLLAADALRQRSKAPGATHAEPV